VTYQLTAIYWKSRFRWKKSYMYV